VKTKAFAYRKETLMNLNAGAKSHTNSHTAKREILVIQTRARMMPNAYPLVAEVTIVYALLALKG